MARSIDKLTIPFDWESLTELETTLRNLEVVGFGKAPRDAKHCNILRSSSDYLLATDTAVTNAVELAEGHADLVVLLLEPADTEATVPHSKALPQTIQCINKELLQSCQTRDWRNTCIMDIRPFRSNVIRKSEPAKSREKQDELAYNATKRMLNALEPDVLLLCQSETHSSSNEFARSLSSSAHEFGDLSLYQLESRKQIVMIHAFHPMYATRYTVNADSVVGRIRKAGLRFAFLQAVNILSGKVIHGPGCKKLRDAVYGASQSPHLLLETGQLDSSLDHRFKGIFLSRNATPEFKRVWEEMMSAKRVEEEKKLETFVSRVSEFGLRPSSLDTVHELQAAISAV